MPKNRRRTRRPAGPAVPVRAAHRPRHAGRVVPWVTFWKDGRPAFGVLSPLHRRRAITEARCQICGQLLGRRIALAVRPSDLAAGYVSEPGMHPECLTYASAACPMLNGTLDTYRAKPSPSVAPLLAPNGDHAGQLAESFEAWFITPHGYEIAYSPGGTVLGLSLHVPVLMRRQIRAAANLRLSAGDHARLRAVLDLLNPTRTDGRSPATLPTPIKEVPHGQDRTHPSHRPS